MTRRKNLNVEGLDIKVSDPQQKDESFKAMLHELRDKLELQRAHVEANPWPTIDFMHARILELEQILEKVRTALEPGVTTFSERVRNRELFFSIEGELKKRQDRALAILRAHFERD